MLDFSSVIDSTYKMTVSITSGRLRQRIKYPLHRKSLNSIVRRLESTRLDNQILSFNFQCFLRLAQIFLIYLPFCWKLICGEYFQRLVKTFDRLLQILPSFPFNSIEVSQTKIVLEHRPVFGQFFSNVDV
jgi:hypothetical protein